MLLKRYEKRVEPMDIKKIDNDTKKYIVENIGYFLLPVLIILAVILSYINFWACVICVCFVFFVWGFQYGMIFKEALL